MKRFCLLVLLGFICCTCLFAQNNDALLAKQYAANGDLQKATEIYQKLYKQDNDLYYSEYENSLLAIKKFDEAISITKKMMRKHPEDHQYIIMLGAAYTQQGSPEKANTMYDELLNSLPPDQNQVNMLAMQFYQNGNIDYAIKIFQQGRKVLKSDMLFSYELINLYRYKNDKAALTEEYLNFLPTNPGFINQAENTLSTLYDGAADYDLLKTGLLKRLQK